MGTGAAATAGAEGRVRLAFLFTDIEGSTRRWADHGQAMERDLAEHDARLRAAFDAHGGTVFSTGGDGFGVAFADAASATRAAVAAQRALAEARWANPDGLTARMGVHVGEASERGGDYFGNDVNVAARAMAAAHGGQIVVSHTVLEALGGRTSLDDGSSGPVSLRPLGEHLLRDVAAPVALWQVEGEGLADGFAPLRTLDRSRTSLPRQRTRLVGGDERVRLVRAALTRSPVVTVVGPGGVGKTRLAVEVAAREQASRPDGTWFVDLAAVGDEAGVGEAIARGAHVDPGGATDALDEVVATLAGSSALLVVDNCEHLLDAAADAVDRLVEGCPGLAVLATSRAALEVAGEHVVPVEPLAAEAVGDPAFRLFVERAVAAGAPVEVDRDAEAVLAACRAVDGLPLAVELAAALARTLPVAEVAERLGGPAALGVAPGRRSRPDRHASVAAAVAWSYELLDDDLRRGFRTLSVFRSSFDLDAAAAVLDLDESAAVAVLGALVARSLVVALPEEGRARFRLLVPLRSFAAEQLEEEGEVAATARRHARHYLTSLTTNPADDAAPWLGDADEWDFVVHQLGKDNPEIVNAADLAMAHGLVDLVVAATSLVVPRLSVSGSIEAALRWTDRGIAHGADDRSVGEAHVMRGFLHLVAGEEAPMVEHATRAEALLGPDSIWWPAAPCIQVAFRAMVDPAATAADYDRAERLAEAQRSDLRPFGRALWAVFSCGKPALEGDFAEALARADQAGEVFRHAARRTVIRFLSATWGALGVAALGRPDEGLDRLDHVADLAPHTGWGTEWELARALCLAQLGRGGEARDRLARTAGRYLSSTWSFQRETLLAAFGLVTFHEGESERAAALLRAARITRTNLGTAVLYHHLAEAEGWPAAELQARRRPLVEAALAEAGGPGPADVRDLLRAEVERAG